MNAVYNTPEVQRMASEHVNPALYIDVDTLRPKPKNDILLIVATAPCNWNDVLTFACIGDGYDVMCINHVALAFGYKFQYFATGDSHIGLFRSIAKELKRQLGLGLTSHCYHPHSNGFDIRWIRKDKTCRGTSTMFGVEVGLALGYLKIVLAGAPMDSSGHFYDKARPDFENRLDEWVKLAGGPLACFIRSMSGNTRDLFGEPTKEWLNE